MKKLLSTGVGLQGSTWCLAFCFERVSELSSRHRVLAELLEQGTRSTLEIPVHKPALSNSNFSQSQQNLRAASGVEYGSLGINPSHALQHPGFYYYLAARCTEMRRSRFLVAVESEVNLDSVRLSGDDQLICLRLAINPLPFLQGSATRKRLNTSQSLTRRV